MMFLFRLLALPVTGPVKGFRFILEQIRDQALAEMLTEEEIQSLMIEASIQHQNGEISDEEYQEVEDRLLEELQTLRQLSAGMSEEQYWEDEAEDEYSSRSE
jgi:hypothetical protein